MPATFDHESLDVYRLELELITWVAELLEEIDELPKATLIRLRETCNQLDRASLSSLLNTAEGNGKRQRPIRAKFFDDARGSATECAACLDALVAKKACTYERVEPGKAMLLRIVQMLAKLVSMYSDDRMVRDETAGYTA
jgi:four helix bundle protein